MVASILPLPPKMDPDAFDTDRSDAELGVAHQEKALQRQLALVDARYQSARWWRNLNRGMSLVGLVLVGVIVALVLVGIRQGWGRS
jgi:hypothetical protein